MNKKSSRGVVCLCLAAGILIAIPANRQPSANPQTSALLSRAEEGSEVQPDAGLKSEEGTVCSGTPDYAKGVTTGPPPFLSIPDKPVFESDRRKTVLSLINFPWQDLGYKVVFMGSRLGYRAMTLTARRQIEIYVRPGEGIMNQAFDLAHELGHAFDLKYNDEERRRKWCQLRGIKRSTPWFGCDACPDYNTPAGDFAETFAYLLLGPGNFHSQIAGIPKPEQVAALAEFCQIEHLSEALIPHAPQRMIPNKIQSEKMGKRAPQPEVSLQPAKATESEQKPAPALDDSHGNQIPQHEVPPLPEPRQFLDPPSIPII